MCWYNFYFLNKNTLVWIIIVLTLGTADIIRLVLNKITDRAHLVITNNVPLVEIKMETLLNLQLESNSNMLLNLFFSEEKYYIVGESI